MRHVYQNCDIKFNLSEFKELTPQFLIKFYTVNPLYSTDKRETDVVDGVIRLDWLELQAMGVGVLQYTVFTAIDDAHFGDGEFNTSYTKSTDYYIDSDIVVDEDDDATHIAEVVADLEINLDAEILRATTADTSLQSQIDSITTNFNAFADDIDPRVEQLEKDVRGITQRLTTDESNISSLQSTVALIVPTVQGHTDSIEALQSDVEGIENACAGFDNSISQLQQDYSDLNGDVMDVNTDIRTINDTLGNLSDGITEVSGEVQTLSTHLSTNYYTKSEIDATLGDINSLLSAI